MDILKTLGEVVRELKTAGWATEQDGAEAGMETSLRSR